MTPVEGGKKKADIGLDPDLIDLLTKLGEIEFEDVEIELEDLELSFQPGAVAAAPARSITLPRLKPATILEAPFTPPIDTYLAQIMEVKLGATKSEGGTRGKSIVIGGEKSPAYYTFENPTPHPPVISFDVFDSEIPLAKAVKMHVKDVLGDPAAWAKLSVDKFGAEMVTLHLVSIDPLNPTPTTPKEAAKA